MSDPTGWDTPKTDWNPADGLSDQDFDRIETNILGIRDWLKQGGDILVNTDNLPGGESQFTISWEKHAQGIVVLYIPEIFGSSTAPGDDVLYLEPNTVWPTEILVANSGIHMPCGVLSNHGTTFASWATNQWEHRESGTIELPYHATTRIGIHRLGNTLGTLVANYGIFEQYITYYTTDTAYAPTASTTTSAP